MTLTVPLFFIFFFHLNVCRAGPYFNGTKYNVSMLGLQANRTIAMNAGPL